jgi:hypothetical protein
LQEAVETVNSILAEVMNGSLMVQSVYSDKVVTGRPLGQEIFIFTSIIQNSSEPHTDSQYRSQRSLGVKLIVVLHPVPRLRMQRQALVACYGIKLQEKFTSWQGLMDSKGEWTVQTIL